MGEGVFGLLTFVAGCGWRVRERWGIHEVCRDGIIQGGGENRVEMRQGSKRGERGRQSG